MTQTSGHLVARTRAIAANIFPARTQFFRAAPARRPVGRSFLSGGRSLLGLGVGLSLSFSLGPAAMAAPVPATCKPFTTAEKRQALAAASLEKTAAPFEAGAPPSKMTSQDVDINNDGKMDRVYRVETSATASTGSELYVAFHGYAKRAELEKRIMASVGPGNFVPDESQWQLPGLQKINLGAKGYENHTYNELAQIDGQTYVFTEPARPIHPSEVFRMNADGRFERVCQFPNPPQGNRRK